MHLSIGNRSWLALLAGVALWGAVAFFAWNIIAGNAAYTAAVLEAKQVSLREASDLKVRALVRETKSARAALNDIVEVDELAMIDAIEKAGRDAGIKVEIGQALASSGSAPGAMLNRANFIVAAGGTFTQVMHVARLLDSLPVPSFVEQFQFERSESSAGSTPSWRVAVRIRFLTTADIAL